MLFYDFLTILFRKQLKLNSQNIGLAQCMYVLGKPQKSFFSYVFFVKFVIVLLTISHHLFNSLTGYPATGYRFYKKRKNIYLPEVREAHEVTVSVDKERGRKVSSPKKMWEIRETDFFFKLPFH